MKFKIWPRRPRKWFPGNLTSMTLATSEGAQGIRFLKSVRSNEKDQVSHSFLVNIFSKSFQRGGVLAVEICILPEKGFFIKKVEKLGQDDLIKFQEVASKIVNNKKMEIRFDLIPSASKLGWKPLIEYKSNKREFVSNCVRLYFKDIHGQTVHPTFFFVSMNLLQMHDNIQHRIQKYQLSTYEKNEFVF